MAQINLLPKDLAPRPTIVKSSGIVKQVIIVGFIIFIVAAIALTALYFIYSRDLKISQGKVYELKTNIKALEATEQRLLLVKDRLEKTKIVLGLDTSMDEIEAADTLLSNLPEGATLSSAEFQATETKMVISSPNTSVLTGMIKATTSGGIYKSVFMKSFSFTPETGFNVELILTR